MGSGPDWSDLAQWLVTILSVVLSIFGKLIYDRQTKMEKTQEDHIAATAALQQGYKDMASTVDAVRVTVLRLDDKVDRLIERVPARTTGAGR